MSLFNWLAEASAPTPQEQLDPTIIPRIKILTEPAGEPVTAEEMALIIKVMAGDEGPLLTALLSSARAWCENWTGRYFITRTAELWLDFWPAPGVIEIPFSPVTAVAAVTFFDQDDVETTLDPATYILDQIGEPARICLKSGVTRPTGLRNVNAVKVSFTAGYANAAAVPENIKTAIRLMAAEVYQARGTQVDARDFMRNTVASKDALLLLEPFKVVR